MLPKIQIRKMGSKFIKFRFQSFMTSHYIKKIKKVDKSYNRSIAGFKNTNTYCLKSILVPILRAKQTKSYFQTTQFVFGLVPNLCIES